MPADLTKLQFEILTGHLLGDGCLFRGKPSHHAYFSMSRTAASQAYLQWTWDNFAGFMLRPLIPTAPFDFRTGKSYPGFQLVSRRAQIFTEWRERWYPENSKDVPEDLNLTPLILAIWWADDGTVCASCSPWRLKMKLATHGFPAATVECLASMLSTRYNAHFGIGRDGAHTFIHAADAGTRAFVEEIDDHIPPGVIKERYWRRPEVSQVGVSSGSYSRTRSGVHARGAEVTILRTMQDGWWGPTELAAALGWKHPSRLGNPLKRFLAVGWVVRENLPRSKYRITDAGILAIQPMK